MMGLISNIGSGARALFSKRRIESDGVDGSA